MDETGIMEGWGINGLVVGAAERKSIAVKSTQARAWTSVVECISATGKALPPAVIFRGKNVQQQWYPRKLEKLPEFAGWLFATSPKGWTDHELALEWLQKIFIPRTHIAGQFRLLIVDGHGSHVTDDFMWECFHANIYLLFLPAHSSHITQPCDLSCFATLKKAYRRLLGDLVLLTDSSPIGKEGFLRCYSQARIEAFKEEVIRAGWLATGLWPINITKPLRSAQLLDPAKEASQSPSSPPRAIPLPPEPEIFTPLRSSQMLQQIMNRGAQSVRTRRLFRKIGKGLDLYAITKAQQDERIKALEYEKERSRPNKRRKVVPNPNERFVEIRQIGEAQAQVAAALEGIEADTLDDSEEEVLSCIYAAN
jgi:4-hydroxybenzoate polyprenyltransferase